MVDQNKYVGIKHTNAHLQKLLNCSRYERSKELKNTSKPKLYKMVSAQLRHIVRLRNLLATTRLEINFLSRQNKMLEERLELVMYKRTYKNIDKRLKSVRRIKK